MSVEHTGYVDDPTNYYMTQCQQKEQDIADLLDRLEQAQHEIKLLRRKLYLRSIN